MAMWLQNLVVLTAVAVCSSYAVWQGIKAVRGKRSRLGSCCDKGCGNAQPQATPTAKIHFLPSDMLTRKKS